MLLTGDNLSAAEHLAGIVGIRDVQAGLLPQDKTAAVNQLQQAGRTVLLVGDGVNDAPALATANVGIAMGGTGSGLALQAADAVIVRDDLAIIPAVITLARRARRVMIANLVFAATVIALLVIWDLVGYLPLPLGVAGHETSTVIVGLNGLRLLSNRARPTPTPRVSRTTAIRNTAEPDAVSHTSANERTGAGSDTPAGPSEQPLPRQLLTLAEATADPCRGDC